MVLVVISISCAFAVNNTDSPIGSTTLNQEEMIIPDESDITLDTIHQAHVDNPIIIQGKVTDNEGKTIKDSDVNLSLNQLNYGDDEYGCIASEIVKTDDAGVFSYTYKSDVGGQLNVTAFSNVINKKINTTVFIAPKSTIISMNEIEDVNIGDNINITGRLTDCDGNALRYTGVGILISGIGYGDFNNTQYIKEYIKTDNDGYYNYIYTPNIGGSLDVSVYYGGYHYYRFNKTTSQIWVTPKSTKVTIDPIENISEEKVTITGRLTDDNNNPLKNTGVGLLFNGGEKVYVKTNSSGNYKYDYTPKYNGRTNVTAYYPGYHIYRFNKTESGFDIIPKDIKITISPIEKIFVKDNVVVRGKVTDEHNNSLANKYFEIILPKEYTRDNKDYTEKVYSNRYGLFDAYFLYSETHPIAGNITVRINLIDDSKYSKNLTYTFSYPELVTEKGNIVLNPINNISFGENLTISGKLINKNNKPIKDRRITVFIDDIGNRLTTNEFGEFYLHLTYLNTSDYTLGKHQVAVCYDTYNILYENKIVARSEFSIAKPKNYSDIPFLYAPYTSRVYDKHSCLLCDVMWVTKNCEDAALCCYIISDSEVNKRFGFFSSYDKHLVGKSDNGLDFSRKTATYLLFVSREMAYHNYFVDVRFLIRVGTPTGMNYYHYNYNEAHDYYEKIGLGIAVAKITVDNGEFKSIEHLIPLEKEYTVNY